MRVAIAQVKNRKGRPEENLGRVEEVLRELASGELPDLLVFPETFLTGYFVENAVGNLAFSREELAERLRRIHTRVFGPGAPPLDIVLGFYEERRGIFHNSALFLPLGTDAPSRVHRKVFLPSYGLFDEARFVRRGSSFRSWPSRVGRMGILICEDAWHSLSGTLLALTGAETIVIPSASPVRGLTGEKPGNLLTWEGLARGMAAEHGVYVVLAQAVGFEGGKGFAGGSLVVSPRGEVLAEAPLWEESLLLADLEPGEIRAARAASPLLADLREALPDLTAELSRLARLPR